MEKIINLNEKEKQIATLEIDRDERRLDDHKLEIKGNEQE
jgi:hypothetical protein